MRLSRPLVGALSAALLGVTPVALTAGPAHAATVDHASRIQLDAQAKSVYRYGDNVTVSGRVVVEGKGSCAGGAAWCRPPETAGSVTLQRLNAGSSTWSTVATWSSESIDFSFPTTAWQNATYRVSYSGGAITGHTFAASDTGRAIAVSRDPNGRVAQPGGRLIFRGNVDPGFARRYVVVQTRKCSRCAWRTYKRVKTTATGAYRTGIFAPRSGRMYWRSKVRGTSPAFTTGYSEVWYTYKSSFRVAR